MNNCTLTRLQFFIQSISEIVYILPYPHNEAHPIIFIILYEFLISWSMDILILEYILEQPCER